jgi:hypothetical protein
MVCSIYRNTAHITRLYGSSDPSQPTVLHGNTCAHEMNVVSTASVLPRTPADINGMLSVVFVGAGKLNPKFVEKIFRVRKKKVQDFLHWLKDHNRLYANILLDFDLFNLFPDDGSLPGIENHIIHDNSICPEQVFSEETAGFSDHHAKSFRTDAEKVGKAFTEHPGDVTDDIDSKDVQLLIDRTGVSDPECDRFSGRSFTASALRNLACNFLRQTEPSVQGVNKPDLVIHRATAAVSEHNNPDLMPGMFPTLFPFGIGGFEDKSRKTPLSFKEQAAYWKKSPAKIMVTSPNHASGHSFAYRNA